MLGFTNKCCYQCAHFVGPVEEEEWDEQGTDGMCPTTGCYVDAFDDACEYDFQENE